MELTKNRFGKTAGIIAMVLHACLACCIPLLAPVLAWLSMSTLGAVTTSWYAEAAGIFAWVSRSFYCYGGALLPRADAKIHLMAVDALKHAR